MTADKRRELNRIAVRRYRAKNRKVLNAKARVAMAEKRASETLEQREIRLQNSRDYYQKNRTEQLNRQRERKRFLRSKPKLLSENRKKENTSARKRYKNDPEYRRKRKLNSARQYYARKLKGILLQGQKHLCGDPRKGDWKGCGKFVPFYEAHIDHILPKCKGGKDEIDNLQVLHATCNQQAGYRTEP